MTELRRLSVGELAEGICLRAGRIAAAQAELLAWIAEFDRREGWAEPGMLSCAHWLSWRISLSLGAAREQVRVARWLEVAPEVASAFADGRISYSKVRAISRVAVPGDGIDWVGLARHSSAAQLEKLARGVARARANAEAEADPELGSWRVRTRLRYDDRGSFSLTISGPAHLLPVVRAGLDARKAELQRRRAVGGSAQASPLEPVTGPAPESVTEPPPQPQTGPTPQPVTDAEALLDLAVEAIDEERRAHPEAARRRRPLLTLQVDPLSGWARQGDGELLPPSSVRRASGPLTSGAGLRLVTRTDLRRHDAGRRQREAGPALRALLGSVDGERCRFPGCSRRRKLHAHHVRYWSRGGRTDLANLVLVCGRHHTLIHAHGYRLALDPDRRLAVATADGRRLPHHPDQPWGDAAALASGCGQEISAETLRPTHTDARLDLGYAVEVLLAQAA